MYTYLYVCTYVYTKGKYVCMQIDGYIVRKSDVGYVCMDRLMDRWMKRMNVWVDVCMYESGYT